MLTVPERIIDRAKRVPDKPFLVLWQHNTYRTISNGQFVELCQSLGAFIEQALPRERGHVFIVLPQSDKLHASMIACMLLDKVPSFLPYPSVKQDPDRYFASHKALFDRSQPQAVITYGDLVERMKAIVPSHTRVINADAYVHSDYLDINHLSLDLDAVGLLQHSSGTTGLKKGVELTHRQIVLQADAYGPRIGLDESACVASWLPLYHDMGLFSSFLIPAAVGATIVAIDPFEWVKAPSILLRIIETLHCTHTWMPNFAFNHIVNAVAAEEQFDLSSMRAFVSCSEPCKPDTIVKFADRFSSSGAPLEKLQACYAMAEATFAVTQSPPSVVNHVLALDKAAFDRGDVEPAHQAGDREIRFVSNGPPLPGIEVGVLDEMTSDICTSDSNRIGEIVLRGAYTFERYYRNTLDTDNAFSSGWYRTGDLGFLLDGNLYISGRKKDVTIVHGRNYYFHDIEAVVSAIPGITPGRAVAISIADADTASEEVLVLAEPIEQYASSDLRKLRRLVKTRIYDVLELTVKTVDFVPAGWLVKTTSGKISRADNLAHYEKLMSTKNETEPS